MFGHSKQSFFLLFSNSFKKYKETQILKPFSVFKQGRGHELCIFFKGPELKSFLIFLHSPSVYSGPTGWPEKQQ